MSTALRLMAFLLLFACSSCTPLPSAMEGVPYPPIQGPMDHYRMEKAKASTVKVFHGERPLGSAVVFLKTPTKTLYLTAAHVVDDWQVGESFNLSGFSAWRGHMYSEAVLVKTGAVETIDLAVLEGPPSDFESSEISPRPDWSVVPGEMAVALGYPLGIFPPVVSVGFIDKAETFHYNHSAAIWFGNSGGPLMDSTWRVIGINVLIAGCENGPHSDKGKAMRLSIIREFIKEYHA